MDLLPANFDGLVSDAVSLFWHTKEKSSTKSQGGTRSSVLKGKHLDGFTQIIGMVATHTDRADLRVVRRGKELTTPGYFRASKRWDVLIYRGHEIVAAIEFKSQQGSFGNNQNNRVEEVIGLGADFWAMHRHGGLSSGGFHDQVVNQRVLRAADSVGSPPPFLGYVMIVEESSESTTPVGISTSPSFPPHPKFVGASYVERYALMADALVSERIYGAVGIVLSAKAGGLRTGENRAVNPPTSFHQVCRRLASHLISLPQ